MSLTTVTLLVLLLFVVQLFLQETVRYHFDLWRIMGNRDERPQKTVLAARLERAKNNMIEALPLFLGLAMLTLFAGGGNAASPGATLFLAARILYVPLYAAGVPVLRSLVWLAGMAGLLMMAMPLL